MNLLLPFSTKLSKDHQLNHLTSESQTHESNVCVRYKLDQAKQYLYTYQSWLLMASPYPGVSTTVKRSFTPRSSISTVEASI